MKKPTKQTALFVVSVLNIIAGVSVAVLLGFIAFMLSQLADDMGLREEIAAITTEINDDFDLFLRLATLSMILGSLVGVIQVVLGVLGIRAARDPSKIAPVWYISIVEIDLSAFVLLVMIARGSVDPDAVVFVAGLAGALITYQVANRIKLHSDKATAQPLRTRIFELVEGDTDLARVYGYGMVVVIVLSLIPLTMKETGPLTVAIEYVCTFVFILDYVLRLITADMKLKRGTESFFVYPVTPMAIIDMLSILPTFVAVNPAIRSLRIVRLVRVIRVFKLFRYLKSANAIVRVFQKHKKVLLVIQSQALAYVIVSALVVFNVEPETFNTFFDAIYWAVVSLTTVGYGDLYPTTDIGRLVSMTSSLVGVAIVALPSGVITAGLIEEFRIEEEEDTQATAQKTLAAIRPSGRAEDC